MIDIENKRNAGTELIDVLPAGTGAAGKSINDITLTDDRVIGYPNHNSLPATAYASLAAASATSLPMGIRFGQRDSATL